MIAKTADLLALPPIRACLFDMDGLLLDTEDIYTKCNNVILAEYGRPNLPWKIKSQLQGRPGPEAAEIFHAWARLPCPRAVFNEKQRALQTLYFPTARPLPGVPLLLKTLKANGVHLALATSSHAYNFKLKSRHNERLFRAFEERKRVLGDDLRIPKGRGKPCPDIYLLALEMINEELRAKGEREIEPIECLVFEDSAPGVEAGRRAGMQVVWCPHPMAMKGYKGREREVLASMEVRVADKIVDGDEIEEGTRSRCSPLARGDMGFTNMVTTLEGLDLKQYGVGVY